jgi:hypothetical protein
MGHTTDSPTPGSHPAPAVYNASRYRHGSVKGPSSREPNSHHGVIAVKMPPHHNDGTAAAPSPYTGLAADTVVSQILDRSAGLSLSVKRHAIPLWQTAPLSLVVMMLRMQPFQPRGLFRLREHPTRDALSRSFRLYPSHSLTGLLLDGLTKTAGVGGLLGQG